MKKLVILMLVMVTLFTTGCDKKVEKREVLLDYISYIQEVSYVGENEKFTVIIDEGKKEEVFVDDGKIGKIVDFTTVKVIPKQDVKGNKLQVVLLSTEENSVELTKDMFTGCFEASCSDKKEYTSIKIDGEEIALTNSLADCITIDKLFEILRVELKEEIESGFCDNKFTKEFYIKLVRDNNSIKNAYYYVALISGENTFDSLLIDCKTGKVLTKKVKNS